MIKKPFKVSARTARLIGRENVSNADGALIELVKNCYDADSGVCVILFDIQYDHVPLELNSDQFLEIIQAAGEFKEAVQNAYRLDDDGNYMLKENLKPEETFLLEDYFKSQNSLFIIDCGEGMTEATIDKHWMTIGTDNKLTDVFTTSGRVKAGAKGIGRFALDRLGKICEMKTFPDMKDFPDTETLAYNWRVNWEDFDQENMTIGDVQADFMPIENGNYIDQILDATDNNEVLTAVKRYERYFNKGTLLHILELRDWWTQRDLGNLYTNLENLSPPTVNQKFNIYFFSKQNPGQFGKVNNEDYMDYDYKITAHVGRNKEVMIDIHRNEFQYNRLDLDLFSRSQMKVFPFDKETFKAGIYRIETSIDELLPGLANSELKEEADKLSDFSFSFFFLKQSASETDKARFFYKNFSRPARNDWFRKFGGIKIYRDNFRVRPYGESGNTAFDWLLLGDRQAKSPAAITKKGAGWRVGPNQVAGVINISRLANLKFEDKSSREGFQENDTFVLFRNLVIAIIHEFEIDRHTVMREMDLLFRDKQAEAAAIQRAEELLEQEKERERANEDSDEDEQPDNTENQNDFREERDAFKEAYQAAKSDLDDAEEEVRMLSALATTGLIVTSFAHEFSSFKWKLEANTNNMEMLFEKLLDREQLYKTLERKRNPFAFIDKLKSSHLGIGKWLDIALAAVQKDKRSIKEINLNEYLVEFQNAWEVVLQTRNVDLIISTNTETELNLNAFTTDIDSIFHNLLVNSFDAFDVKGFVGPRRISIGLDVFYSPDEEKDLLEISYSDSGPGLDKKIKNPYLILRRGYTTKVDMNGNENGTGLGMWLINDAVQYYGGILEIMQPEKGFELKIRIPYNNKIKK